MTRITRAKGGRIGLLALLALAPALAACDGVVDAEPVRNQATEAELVFLRVAPDAPPLTDSVVSFWAVSGETREVEIRYLPTAYYSGGKCLRFKVPSNALLAAPDGRRYQRGDSVQITIRMPDLRRFDFEFQPTGLRFDPEHPAELEIRYRWADADVNGDGVVDARDEALRQRFGLWKQERRGEAWYQWPAGRDETSLELKAQIAGFTRYALATN